MRNIVWAWPLQHPSDSGAGDGGDKGGGDKGAGDGTIAGGDGKTKTDAAGDTTKTETKKDGEKQPETKSKAGEDKPQPKAPEKYALKLPDGGRLDASDLTYIEEIARKADWTNDEAQAAVDEHLAVIEAQSNRYLAATKADKDYGGEKLTETQTLARAVIDRIRPVGHARRDSFIQFLNRGGAGNHLEVVSFLADLGKLMAEDTTVGGRGGSGKPKDATDVLYGGGG